MKEPVVPGYQPKRRDGGGAVDQSLRPALDYRATVPRTPRISAVRDGAILHPCRRADARRDRLLLISAFATALLTLLGAVGVSAWTAY